MSEEDDPTSGPAGHRQALDKITVRSYCVHVICSMRDWSCQKLPFHAYAHSFCVSKRDLRDRLAECVCRRFVAVRYGCGSCLDY